MLVIGLPSAIKRLALPGGKKVMWCFAGKDLDGGVARELNLKGWERHYLNGRLEDAADRLRQPFLDFVAAAGSRQKDKIKWWAGRLASKSPFHTDFFLLLCHKAVIGEITQEYRDSDEVLVIIVEDRWLFKDLKSSLQAEKIRGTANLAMEKVLLFARGIFSRVLFAGQMILVWTVLKLLWRGPEPGDGKAVGLVSYAEKRAIHGCTFKDPYTGGLESFIKENGMGVVRVLMPRVHPGLVLRLRKMDGEIWPLLKELRLSDLRLFIGSWQPELGKKRLEIGGVDAKALLDREIWMERGGWSYGYYRIVHTLFRRFFRKKRCGCMIYLFENQPWEKMACMAAKDAGVKMIGHQHSTVPHHYHSFYSGKGEACLMPLPDKIMTTSETVRRRLREGGLPEATLKTGGSWRYAYLSGNADSKEDRATSRSLLVLAPVEPSIARSLISFMNKVFPEGGANDGLEIFLKLHPHLGLKGLGFGEGKLESCALTDEPLEGLLKRMDTVMCSCSTAGIEALVAGRKVIRFVPDNVIGTDPLKGVTHENLFVVHERDGREKVLEAVRTKTARFKRKTIIEDYFSTVRHDAWLEEVC